jgi:hypothetical protein
VHCQACGKDFVQCPSCAEPLTSSLEKGVDTAIVTDLMSMAWQSAFDVAILVSSDADFVPAVQRIQERGLRVINATWQHDGHELRRTCWASFDLDGVARNMLRGPSHELSRIDVRNQLEKVRLQLEKPASTSDPSASRIKIDRPPLS